MLIENIKVPICRAFIVSLYDISVKRIRNIQKKIILGHLTMIDKRGKHATRPHRLDDDVIRYFHEHIEAIPSKESHYSPSKRRYFENPDLNITKLYELFQEYYYEKTQKQLRLKYSTYFKIFRARSPVSFKQPKTDICNVCEAFNQLKDPTQIQKQEQDIHIARHKAHTVLKHYWLERAERDDTILVIQFDYAQNYPLPKLNVNAQFYLRLFWIYLFNIHVYNDGRSKMYLFPQGSANKDSSSVASFLFDFLAPLLDGPKKFNKIIMLSDNCGGQNKNQYLIKFCLWLSALHPEIEIHHIFPVVGHTFNINDSNFGIIRKRVKRVPRIVNIRTLLEMIVIARKTPSPFELLYDADMFYNWTDALEPFFLAQPVSLTPGCKLNIRSRCQLKYVNGRLYATSSYGSETWIAFDYFKPEVLASKSFCNLTKNKVIQPGFSAAKIKDVKELYKYLSEEEIFDFESIFNLNSTPGLASDRDNTSSTPVPAVEIMNVVIPEPVDIGNLDLVIPTQINLDDIANIVIL
jgi:hypothetical protein